MKTYKFKGEEVSLNFTSYESNGTLAVEMIGTEDEEPYAVLTVNLDCPIQNDSLAFVDENNLPGIGKWLQKNGLARPLGYTLQSGFCVYELYEFVRRN